MNKLPINQINVNLILLGLVTNGKAISFKAFKERADVHDYGRGRNKIYIIYVGSRDNMFAFYPPQTNKAESLKIAYQYFVDIATTDMKQEFIDENVMWGNCGIPLVYGGIRCDL